MSKLFIELKGNKQPIGMYEDSKAFTNHSLELNKNDTLYILAMTMPTNSALRTKN